MASSDIKSPFGVSYVEDIIELFRTMPSSICLANLEAQLLKDYRQYDNFEDEVLSTLQRMVHLTKYSESHISLFLELMHNKHFDPKFYNPRTTNLLSTTARYHLCKGRVENLFAHAKIDRTADLPSLLNETLSCYQQNCVTNIEESLSFINKLPSLNEADIQHYASIGQKLDSFVCYIRELLKNTVVHHQAYAKSLLTCLLEHVEDNPDEHVKSKVKILSYRGLYQLCDALFDDTEVDFADECLPLQIMFFHSEQSSSCLNNEMIRTFLFRTKKSPYDLMDDKMDAITKNNLLSLLHEAF